MLTRKSAPLLSLQPVLALVFKASLTKLTLSRTCSRIRIVEGLTWLKLLSILLLSLHPHELGHQTKKLSFVYKNRHCLGKPISRSTVGAEKLNESQSLQGHLVIHVILAKEA